MSSDAFDPEPPQQPPVEDWTARIDELLVEAEAAPAGAERTAVLCRISEIYERRLGDPNGALMTLQTALAEDPASGRVIQEMERIARGHGSWGELSAATAEVAGGLADPKQAADLGCRSPFGTRPGARSSTRPPGPPRPRWRWSRRTVAPWRCSRISTGGSGAGSATSRSWAQARAPRSRPRQARRRLPRGAAVRATPHRCARRPRAPARGDRRLGRRRRPAPPPDRRAARGGRGSLSVGAAAEGAARRRARRRGGAGAGADTARRRDARAEPAPAGGHLPRAHRLAQGAAVARARGGGGDRRRRQDPDPRRGRRDLRRPAR